MRIRRWLYPGILLTATILLLVDLGIPQNEKTAKVDSGLSWVKYDKGLVLAAKENKPILIDFYTNWCGWCKKMDRETFSNDSVAQYLNDRFITVRVNAESNEMLATGNGSLSEKDLSRSFGVRGYPTYWFLKSNGEKINNISGYSPPDRFITVLKYIGDSHYQTKTWQEYLKSLESN